MIWCGFPVRLLCLPMQIIIRLVPCLCGRSDIVASNWIELICVRVWMVCMFCNFLSHFESSPLLQKYSHLSSRHLFADIPGKSKGIWCYQNNNSLPPKLIHHCDLFKLTCVISSSVASTCGSRTIGCSQWALAIWNCENMLAIVCLVWIKEWLQMMDSNLKYKRWHDTTSTGYRKQDRDKLG